MEEDSALVGANTEQLRKGMCSLTLELSGDAAIRFECDVRRLAEYSRAARKPV